MKARETIYYGVSLTFGRLLDIEKVQRFLEWLGLWLPVRSKASESPVGWMGRHWGKIWLLTSGLLLGVNAVLAAINRRLLPDDDPLTRQLLEDVPNLINYLIICPAYVLLSLALVTHIGTLRVQLSNSGLWPALGLPPASEIKSSWRWTGVILAFAAGMIAIARYSAELREYRVLFWFQEDVAGVHVLGTTGNYYLLSNFVLNVIALLVVVAQFEVFAIAAQIGRSLKAIIGAKGRVPDDLTDKKKCVKLLRPYVEIYLISKLLVVVFLLNMYTWRAQQADFAGMLSVTIVLVAVLGALIVSYPRYHVQYWLFRTQNDEASTEYPEIRAAISAGVASLTDIIILGAAMTNLVLGALHNAGIDIKFW